MLFLLILVFSFLNAINSRTDYAINADYGRSIPELILSRGFRYQQHEVETVDNYHLMLHRIINPYVTAKNLRPVFLQHGILASGSNYLKNAEGFINPDGIYTENGGTIINSCNFNLNRTGRTLGFVLSACGYDVWLGNSRGTSYSKKCANILCYFFSSFWDFSFQQMAFYDTPASIDYVLKTTNSKSLAYIAHSQGTTQMFALLSARPEYSSKINLYVAMAPVVYLTNIDTEYRIAANWFENSRLYPVPILVGQNRIGGIIGSLYNYFYGFLVESFCTGSNSICERIIRSPYINSTRTEVYFSELDYSSTRCFEHFGQIITKQDFVYFDYGSRINRNKYGTYEAPVFNVSAINSTKLALFYGQSDFIVNITDVQHLISQLKVKLLYNYSVPLKGWTHMDFIVANLTGSLINPRILYLLHMTSDTSV